ncbi:hypothetical protein D3C81_10610 [compost metagenome]
MKAGHLHLFILVKREGNDLKLYRLKYKGRIKGYRFIISDSAFDVNIDKVKEYNVDTKLAENESIHLREVNGGLISAYEYKTKVYSKDASNNKDMVMMLNKLLLQSKNK